MSTKPLTRPVTWMSLRTRMYAHRARLLSGAQNLDDPASRRRAWWYVTVYDHGALRIFWSNFAEIAPGVYRSNHPDRRRLRRYADKGIKTVLNLRGSSQKPNYLFETEACRTIGVDLVDVEGMKARKAPSTKAMLDLIDAMRHAEKPYLVHCKSGADRTSLASAVHKLVFQGATVREARRQLSIRFIHFKWTRSGVLDHILDHYEMALKGRELPFEEWVRTEYDARAVKRSFKKAHQ